MINIDLQIEEIESARQELKKHFGEHYELSALTHTIPLLEELKELRAEISELHCERQSEGAFMTEYEAQIRADVEEEVENRLNRVLDDEKRISYKEGKAEMLKEINEKMSEIVSAEGEKYGGLCIEVYCDAFSDLGEWIAEQLMKSK